MAALLVVANRAPVSFAVGADGELLARRGAGGMIAIASLMGGHADFEWVSAAMTDGDRAAAAQGRVEANGLKLRLIDIDPEVYGAAYDGIANGTLWYLHHGLFDRARQPTFDGLWRIAWDHYRSYNRAFAEAVAEDASEGAVVLVQDYHLALLGGHLAEARPDLRVVHFSHTPFATPEALGMLPDPVRAELLEGMAGYRACGFHSQRWAARFEACFSATGAGQGTPAFVAPLVPALDQLADVIGSPEGAEGERWLDGVVGDRTLLLRVDRIEPSKNLLRGFLAFDELLQQRPDWRGRVVFVARVYPSRENMHEYVAYRAEAEKLVSDINARWQGVGSQEDGAPWQPIVLDVSDNAGRSAAAFTRYDVLLVNPIRDGLNLVAMEGPSLNQKDGVLALSREAAAWDSLKSAALEINPFDVSGTAEQLGRALDMSHGERAKRSKALRDIIDNRHPEAWLEALLTAAGD